MTTKTKEVTFKKTGYILSNDTFTESLEEMELDKGCLEYNLRHAISPNKKDAETEFGVASSFIRTRLTVLVKIEELNGKKTSKTITAKKTGYTLEEDNFDRLLDYIQLTRDDFDDKTSNWIMKDKKTAELEIYGEATLTVKRVRVTATVKIERL